MAIPGQNGRHFTDGNGGNALSLVVDPATPSVIYAGGYEWFRSVDGGVTWSARLTTTNAYQHGLTIQPGSPANAVLVNEQGVYWATGWGDAAVSATPTLLRRSAGYRVGNVTSAAMKPAPGGPYLLNTANESGTSTITGSGLSVGTPVFSFQGGNSAGRTFIDENELGLQVFSSYNAWYRFDGVTPTYLFGLNSSIFLNPAAYDSQNNRLYVVEYVNNAYAAKRVTGLTSTIVSTSFSLPGSPDVIQLGSDQSSLLAGFFNSLLVKYTNMGQTTPTATTLATGSVLPPNASISGIDVGATDNELLVTLLNYGVASVWYTSNGGTTWISKDAAGSGLPDVPVRMGLFNPQNRQQVILATDLGIWTTNDITATNPGWELSNAGMPLIRINQLRYRASDGRLIAATAGRGIFETNAFAIAYAPSAIALTDVANASLCAGSPLSVSFTTNGPAFGGAVTYDVWVSDASGSFTAQRRIGTGTGSPITVTLPTGSNALPSGANYRVRVVAPNLDITSDVSNALTIGSAPVTRITDRATSPWYTSNTGNACAGDPVRLSAATTNAVSGSAVVADTYQWLLGGTAIAGATSQTYLTGVAGTYQVQVQQTGCTATSGSYSVQHPSSGITLGIISRFGDLPQCEDTPAILVAQYIGEQAAMQWVRNGADIAGATSGTYVAAQSGAYSYRITRAGCNAFPVASNVTLGRSLAALLIPLSGDTVLCGGALKGAVYFNMANIYSSQTGNGGYSIAWYRDNVPSNQSLNQTSIGFSQPGRYTYELRQGTCVTRSNAVVITEGVIASPLIQLGSDYTKAFCPGDLRFISVAGGQYTTYQWQRDGIDIPGATQYGYTAQLSGSYTVRTTKGSCAAGSPPFSLTFSNALRPQIQLFGGATQACNELYLYGYQGINAGNVTYQWLKDGTPIAGSTGTQYTVTQAGLYSLSVTSGACTGLSKPIYMRPNTIRKPVIFADALITAVCAGNAILLSMVSSRGPVQWKRNGVVVSTGNPSSFYVTQPGLYTVQETTSCGVAESDPVEVKIGETTSAALSGGAFVGSGQPAHLPVVLSGPAPWSFTLSNGQSVQSTYLNPHMVSVSATATTTYTVSGVENACGTGTSAGQAVVTVGSGQADLSVLTQVSNRAPAVDEIVTYSLQISNAGPNNAANVQITNRLPVGMAFVDAQSPGISAVSGVVSGIVGTVPVDQPVTVSYRVRITQPGIYFTAAEVTATSTPDPDSQPNSGTGDGQDDAATVDLRTAEAGGGAVNSPNPGQVRLPPVISRQPPVPTGQVELSLAMRSSTIAPKVGEAVNLSVVVTNRGALTATYVVVQVVLPPGWAVTNGAGFVVTGQTVQAYIYQLPAGSPQVLVLPLQANGAGSATLHAHLLEVTEPTANATPGNGFQNGERDEASLLIQVR